MGKTTLTPEQWEMVFSLPADGNSYHIDGVAHRAKHLPPTKMKCEQVIVDSGAFGVMRRVMQCGKWCPTDYIASY